MTKEQRTAAENLCKRWNKPFREQDYSPSFGCGDGWIEGWVGGTPIQSIYVGISPEGSIHS